MRPFFFLLLCLLVLLSAPALTDCFANGPAAQGKSARTFTWEDLRADPQSQYAHLPNPKLSGSLIRLYGFVVPLERDVDQALREFLLVPYFGACIHVPPPPADQIIEVTLQEPLAGIVSMDTGWVTGVLTIDTTGGAPSYSMKNARFEMEEGHDIPTIVKALLLTVLCGFSVALGWVGPLARKRLSRALSSLGMAVASGMLVGLGCSALAVTPNLMAAGFFCLTLLLASLLLRKRHGHKEEASDLSVAFGVCLHNYPECFLVCSVSMANGVMGTVLALAMLAHNLPLGLSLGLGQGEHEEQRPYLCAMIAGVLPPLGALATFFLMRSLVSPEGMRLLMTGAGGVLVALAFFELLPHALRLGSRLRVLTGFLLGVLVLGCITFFLTLQSV